MKEDIPSSKKRRPARYAADLPIEIKLNELVPSETEYLNNISNGGLSFKSKLPLDKSVSIRVRIPLIRPVFEAVARVAWCRRNGDYFDIGAEFVGAKDGLKIRMVEQICIIEKYKKQVLEKEGRKLTGEQAALEWISKFAGTFGKE